jgi:hypothetical protein
MEERIDPGRLVVHPGAIESLCISRESVFGAISRICLGHFSGGGMAFNLE